MWSLWLREESKKAAQFAVTAAAFSLVTMALTLFAKNMGFRVVWWIFGGLMQLTLALFFVLFVTVFCEINILRPLFQFCWLPRAFPTLLHAPDNCSTVCRETSPK